MLKLNIPFIGKLLVAGPREGMTVGTFETTAKITRKNGEVEDLGVVSRKMVTQDAVCIMAALFGGDGTIAVNQAANEQGDFATASAVLWSGITLQIPGWKIAWSINSAAEAVNDSFGDLYDGVSIGTAVTSVTAAYSGNNATLTIVGTRTMTANDVSEAGGAPVPIRSLLVGLTITDVNDATGTICFDRSLVGLMNLNEGDGVTFTYTLTINSGG
jgi:hypothetical protein